MNVFRVIRLLLLLFAFSVSLYTLNWPAAAYVGLWLIETIIYAVVKK